jgi:hypothetical protein
MQMIRRLSEYVTAMFDRIISNLWESFGKQWPAAFRIGLYVICCFLALVVAEFIFNYARSAHKMLNPDQYPTAKRPAKLQLVEWTLKPDLVSKRLEVSGRFFNTGEVDTVATITNQVLLAGKDVTVDREKGPDHLDYTVGEKRTLVGGPIFYLHGDTFDAAVNTPDKLEIHSIFIYPDGVGSSLQLDHAIGFEPKLKIVVLRNETTKH